MQLIIYFFLSKEVDAGTVTMLVLGVGVEMSDTKSSKRPGAKVLVVTLQGGYEDEDEAVWVMDGQELAPCRGMSSSFSMLLYL